MKIKSHNLQNLASIQSITSPFKFARSPRAQTSQVAESDFAKSLAEGQAAEDAMIAEFEKYMEDSKVTTPATAV